MKDRPRHPVPSKLICFVGSALLVIPFTACSSSDGSGDKTAPTVSASPPTGTFATTVDVTLTAMDAKDPDPDIYYTTDLTEPTAASTLYSAPFTVSATTVVKFMAVDKNGNESGTKGCCSDAALGLDGGGACGGGGKALRNAFAATAPSLAACPV